MRVVKDVSIEALKPKEPATASHRHRRQRLTPPPQWRPSHLANTAENSKGWKKLPSHRTSSVTGGAREWM